jgi:hypothetical protein
VLEQPDNTSIAVSKKHTAVLNIVHPIQQKTDNKKPPEGGFRVSLLAKITELDE